jgi:prolyl-tRNA editing enzyme YbaK/EbsC (Cys-tRNA(Pro) deacylase)
MTDTTTGPVRSHPTVTRVTEALRSLGAGGEVRWLAEPAKTAALAAEALGIEVGAIANSLVFTFDDAPILVMTSGAHRVDTAWLGEQLDGRIRRADADTVRAATGQAIGGVAPVGHLAPLRTFVDAALADYPQIWAAAGHADTVFPTTFEELVAITGATVTPVEAPRD